MAMQQASMWNMQNWNLGLPLKEAYKAIDSALRPHRPIRAITKADILAVDPHLSVWETSQEISVLVKSVDKGPLVDEMTHLIRYISSLPDLPDTDCTDQLRQRVVQLGHHIQTRLLQEAQAKQRELSPTPDDENANDVLLLQNWGQQIRKELLDDGAKSIIGICDHVPRIFDFLKVCKDFKFSSLVESKFPLVLRAVIEAPCIPNIWSVTNFRSQAAMTLKHWAQMPEVQVLTSEEKAKHGLDIVGIEIHISPPISTSATPDIVYRLGEIATTLEELEKAAADMDVENIIRLIKKMEEWGPIEDSSLVTSLNSKIRRISMKIKRAAESNNAATEEATTRIENLLASHRPAYAGRRRLTGFSYHEGAPNPVITLCFKNTGTGVDSHPHLWEDVLIKCSLYEPLQRVLERFMTEANRLNRHPFSPVVRFSLSSDKDIYELPSSLDGNNNTEPNSITCIQTSHVKFSQGRVSSVKFAPNEYVVYYIRGKGDALNESLELRKFATSRTLPSSCVPPPKHWYVPSPPRGRDTDWDTVNSLAFVGNGDEIWPYATYPPVIASHIYIPKAIESLSDSTAAFNNRGPVHTDVTPFKLFPPLSVDQAKGLVGHTIQYEEQLDPFAAVKEPTTKKRRLEDGGSAHAVSSGAHTPNWEHVFFAFVWGFDPERMELKVFENFERRDVSRTILVGPLKTEFPVPVPPGAEQFHDFNAVALRHPFMPTWLGSVRLPGGASPDPLIGSDIAQNQAEDRSSSTPEGEREHAAYSSESRERRLSNILEKTPREFEVGIGGDFSLLVGELGIQEPDSIMIEKIDNCKAGIWESGCNPPDEDESLFSIWVQWVREGTIDLSQSVDAFGNVTDDIRPLPPQLLWTRATDVSVDGGTVSILARGITDERSIAALTGIEPIMDIYSFVQCMVMPGHEDGRFYIPGGVTSSTGGDGSFGVDVASDGDGKIIAVKVSDTVFGDEDL